MERKATYNFEEATQLLSMGISGFRFRNAMGNLQFAKRTLGGITLVNVIPTEGLDFGEALEYLKQGKRVARSGWNGKNMFLFLVGGSENLTVDREPLMSILGKGSTFNYQPHVDMLTADGSIVPWLCSQSDMLATDWCIVPDA